MNTEETNLPPEPATEPDAPETAPVPTIEGPGGFAGGQRYGVNRKTCFVGVVKQAAFLKHYEKTMNKTKAAQLAGLKNAKNIHAQAAIDADFKDAIKQIEEAQLDLLQARLYKEAEHRPDDRRFILARKRPEEWGDRKHVEVSGTVEHAHSVQELSDADLVALLRQERQQQGRPVAEAEIKEATH